MKKIGILMVSLLIVSGSIMAQGPRRGNREMDPKVRAERMTERMAQEYSLDDAQKAKLLELNLSLAEKANERPAHAPEQKGDKANKHAKKGKKATCNCDQECCKNHKKDVSERVKREGPWTEYDSKLKEIMTDDQYKAYTQKRGERQGRPGYRPGSKK